MEPLLSVVGTFVSVWSTIARQMDDVSFWFTNLTESIIFFARTESIIDSGNLDKGSNTTTRKTTYCNT
jgi:hypothetical protein